VLPAAVEPLPPVPKAATAPVLGMTPFFTPNDSFYRIDTAIFVPRVDVKSWQLDITGLVRRPLSFTYDDLLRRDLVEADCTLMCVSNEVGGDLIGTARWLGVPLRELLDEAGVQPAGTQLVGVSVDGFTAGFPTKLAMDGRNALVAVGMNGEPLPFAHGYPARLVVPGIYGYVSATKWLRRIHLERWEDFDGYWIPRGWSKEAPIKTGSRIDVPRRGRRVPVGPTAIAGVAWAQHRGISKVEVQVDDGPWREATLAAADGVDTWRQWHLNWRATEGQHQLRVRATDGRGVLQAEEHTVPAPDGATGWHTVWLTAG
jgi:DMSO/TMAO reductase YedYZ molybdopterin-dependent catalytic subunit